MGCVGVSTEPSVEWRHSPIGPIGPIHPIRPIRGGDDDEGEHEESRLVHKQTRDDSAEQKTNGHFESRMTL